MTSFISKLNSIGLRQLPWGTPQTIFINWTREFNVYINHRILPARYDLIQVIALSEFALLKQYGRFQIRPAPCKRSFIKYDKKPLPLEYVDIT